MALMEWRLELRSGREVVECRGAYICVTTEEAAREDDSVE